MAQNSSAANYEDKYAEFIKMTRDSQQPGTTRIVVDQPWVLGDNYDEIIESLSRLADAGLTLHIVRRAE